MKTSLNTAEELARIGREHDLAELEYEDESVKIHLTFEAPPTVAPAAFDPALLASLAPAGAPAYSNGTARETVETPRSGGSPEGETINSPLAGVFYRSPRPDAPSFVEEEATVAAGQTLCIVEAMKLMNEITSERPCKIVKILVENAEAVEEGQPLFIIA